MRLIDADAFDKCLEGAEIEATKSQKYVFSSAINTIRGNLANFPTVNQWVPCSERPPEEEIDVFVCNANGDIEISRGSYSTEMRDYFIWYTSGWRFGEPIAWMPLPEPYRGEGEEE